MINGDRIRQAREIRGFTQKELADKIGITQAAIAQFEGNLAAPLQEKLEAIALQTGFPIAFFKQCPSLDFPLGTLLFRARTSVKYADKNLVRQYGKLSYETVEKMETKLKGVSLRLPKYTGDPVTAASLTRSSLGLSPDTPVEYLIDVIEKGGVLVLSVPKVIDKHDAFSLWTGKDLQRPVIVIATDGPADRLRFSVSHELGHLVMHQKIDKDIDDVEREANRFAGEFLMPEAAMLEEIGSPVTLMSLQKLGGRWKVSVQALMKRASDLGIISLRQYKYLLQQLGARGLRTESLVNIPLEKPRAVRQMAEMIYGDPIDFKKMAADLNLPPAMVEEMLEKYAEKHRRHYPAGERKPSGAGKLMVFVKKK
ncbi:MAG: XRE family transcriptional regulator [Deltaproteobacteria bacterium]|nr:XRE family transcriptional regulator [Deltaproteobacteria bacterium]